MRIAIDARELAGKPTGVGRFVRELLTAWASQPAAHRHEFVLCAPAEVDLAPFSALRISTAIAPGDGTVWEQFSLPRLLRKASAEVLFAPAYSAPLRSPIPFVVAIHDVSFAAHPEWFSWREGARRRVLARLSAERARRVLTISEFSKREIASHLGIEPGKVVVAYPGVTRIAGTNTDSLVARSASVLYVGSIFSRRHVPELIAAFAQIARRHPEVELDIVGDNRTSPPSDVAALANRTGVGSRIHLRSYVSDEELARLYGRASAFAFLSDYEGFGLTPLEAMAAGVPSVVLDTPVAREVYEDAALYVPTAEPRGVTAALERLLFDEPTRESLRRTADRVLARFTWDACAARVLRLLETSR